MFIGCSVGVGLGVMVVVGVKVSAVVGVDGGMVVKTLAGVGGVGVNCMLHPTRKSKAVTPGSNLKKVACTG